MKQTIINYAKINHTVCVMLADVNECENNPCKNGATCVNGVGKYSCICVGGYDGTDCDNGKYCDR